MHDESMYAERERERERKREKERDARNIVVAKSERAESSSAAPSTILIYGGGSWRKINANMRATD